MPLMIMRQAFRPRVCRGTTGKWLYFNYWNNNKPRNSSFFLRWFYCFNIYIRRTPDRIVLLVDDCIENSIQQLSNSCLMWFLPSLTKGNISDSTDGCLSRRLGFWNGKYSRNQWIACNEACPWFLGLLAYRYYTYILELNRYLWVLCSIFNLWRQIDFRGRKSGARRIHESAWIFPR